jgi:GTPase SAR1 family protein
VFDITDPSSYQGIDSWIEEVKKYTAFERMCKILVGTKSDLESARKVSAEQGKV